MPRNWRNSRSSASIVTLVRSSPFHHPARSWRPTRCARARVTATLASSRRLVVLGCAVTLSPWSVIAIDNVACNCDKVVDDRPLGRQRVQTAQRPGEVAVGLAGGPVDAAGLLDQFRGQDDVVVAARRARRQQVAET